MKKIAVQSKADHLRICPFNFTHLAFYAPGCDLHLGLMTLYKFELDFMTMHLRAEMKFLGQSFLNLKSLNKTDRHTDATKCIIMWHLWM